MTDCPTAAVVAADTMDESVSYANRRRSMSRLRSRRITTVLLAPLAALVAWALFRAAGVPFHVSTGNGRVDGVDVVVAATLAALIGWIVIRQLERRVQRPRLWWGRIASTALAVSIVGPAHLADGSSSAALMALHLITAVVIIAGFATTTPRRRREVT